MFYLKSSLADLRSLDQEGCWKKSHDNTTLDHVKLEIIEEEIVTAALETILLNASRLFLTSKGESLNGDNAKQTKSIHKRMDVI